MKSLFRMAIVLLFGIPGSGKSTLAQEISRISATPCHIVSFDALENDLVWDESSFKRLRKCNLDAVKDIVDSLPVSTTAESNGFPGLILVDDIMYLRSMRREVYVVAREKNIPIIVVWINTPLEVALQRNSQRVGMQHIDEETITKIHNSLEPPDSQRICDRNHVIIDGACEDSINRGVVAILSQAPVLWQKSQQEAQMQRQIQQTSVQRCQGSNESLVKQLDLALRNIVAYAMKPVAKCKSLGKPLSAAFATAKAHMLSKARHSVPWNNRAERTSEGEEQQQWLRAMCVEFLSVVEMDLAVSCAAGTAETSGTVAEVNDILDLTRVYVAEKVSV